MIRQFNFEFSFSKLFFRDISFNKELLVQAISSLVFWFKQFKLSNSFWSLEILLFNTQRSSSFLAKQHSFSFRSLNNLVFTHFIELNSLIICKFWQCLFLRVESSSFELLFNILISVLKFWMSLICLSRTWFKLLMVFCKFILSKFNLDIIFSWWHIWSSKFWLSQVFPSRFWNNLLFSPYNFLFIILFSLSSFFKFSFLFLNSQIILSPSSPLWNILHSNALFSSFNAFIWFCSWMTLASNEQ